MPLNKSKFIYNLSDSKINHFKSLGAVYTEDLDGNQFVIVQCIKIKLNK